ncbi:MAG: uracil phosphoribosyltransferase [Candidatus Riflebacteria bacterium]|nr:uracil phosphoribosyltransferase [Candidatus Riflebacteria bacterium]
MVTTVPERQRIAIGADHAGLEAKRQVGRVLQDKGIPFDDLGTHTPASVDYPDYAQVVAGKVSRGEVERGILICGSGIGMSIAANRFPRVRAALCTTEEMARLSRQHNDSNVLVLAARLTPLDDVSRIVDAWLVAPFEGGRHSRRVEKVETPCDRRFVHSMVTIIDHPMIQHKLTVIRDEACDTKVFREVVDEISSLMAYEITRDIPTDDKQVRTPMKMTVTGKYVRGGRVGIVPILRAGLGMIHGILKVIPMAAVGHIGIYRDHDTLKPVEYYCKLPGHCEDLSIIVVDPMLATGGSAVAAIDYVKKRGAKRIKFNCILAAPEGIERLTAAHPDVEIVAAGIDERLNEVGYILPGLGDAGDRLFGTK